MDHRDEWRDSDQGSWVDHRRSAGWRQTFSPGAILLAIVVVAALAFWLYLGFRGQTPRDEHVIGPDPLGMSLSLPAPADGYANVERHSDR